jgi:hypothetical protein
MQKFQGIAYCRAHSNDLQRTTQCKGVAASNKENLQTSGIELGDPREIEGSHSGVLVDVGEQLPM